MNKSRLKPNSLRKHISKEVFVGDTYLKEDLNKQLKKGRLKFEEAYFTTLKNYFTSIAEYGNHLDQINKTQNSLDLIVEDEKTIFEQISRLNRLSRILENRYHLSNEQINNNKLIREIAHDIKLVFFTEICSSEEELKEIYSPMQKIGNHINLLAIAKYERLENKITITKVDLEELKELTNQSMKYFQKEIDIQLIIESDTQIYASKAQIYDYLTNGVKNDHKHGKSSQTTITLKKGEFNNNINYVHLIIEGNGPTAFPLRSDLKLYGITAGPTAGTGKGMHIMNKAIQIHSIDNYLANMTYGGKKVIATIPQQIRSPKT